MRERSSRFQHNDIEDIWIDISCPISDDQAGEPQFEEVTTIDIVSEYDALAEAFRKISIDLHVESRRAGIYLSALQKADPKYMLEPISDPGLTVSDSIEHEIGSLVSEVNELRFDILKARATVLPIALYHVLMMHQEATEKGGPTGVCQCCKFTYPCSTARILSDCVSEICAGVDAWTARRLSL